MKAGVLQRRRVSDVVQPRGRDEQLPILRGQGVRNRLRPLANTDHVPPTVRVDVEKSGHLG